MCVLLFDLFRVFKKILSTLINFWIFHWISRALLSFLKNLGLGYFQGLPLARDQKEPVLHGSVYPSV